MKRVISISLILIVITNSILFGLIYVVIKGKLKNEFLSTLDLRDKDTPVTKVTSDDISNQNITVLEDDELKINNEFFDVFKTEYVDGKTIYYCFSDDNEEHLEKALNNFMSFSLKNFSSKSVVSLFKLLNIIAFPVSFQNNSIIPFLKTKSIVTKYNLQEVTLSIPTPPPEIIFS